MYVCFFLYMYVYLVYLSYITSLKLIQASNMWDVYSTQYNIIQYTGYPVWSYNQKKLFFFDKMTSNFKKWVKNTNGYMYDN